MSSHTLLLVLYSSTSFFFKIGRLKKDNISRHNLPPNELSKEMDAQTSRVFPTKALSWRHITDETLVFFPTFWIEKTCY